jgi:hypothetical protein
MQAVATQTTGLLDEHDLEAQLCGNTGNDQAAGTTTDDNQILFARHQDCPR